MARSEVSALCQISEDGGGWWWPPCHQEQRFEQLLSKACSKKHLCLSKWCPILILPVSLYCPFITQILLKPHPVLIEASSCSSIWSQKPLAEFPAVFLELTRMPNRLLAHHGTRLGKKQDTHGLNSNVLPCLLAMCRGHKDSPQQDEDAVSC